MAGFSLLKFTYICFPFAALSAVTAVWILWEQLSDIKAPTTETLSYVLDYFYLGAGFQGIACTLGFLFLFFECGGKYAAISFWIMTTCTMFFFATVIVRSIFWLQYDDTEKITDMVFYAKVVFRKTNTLTQDFLVTEKRFNCCGVSAYHDYEVIFEERRVPDHCCINHVKGCGYELLHGPEYYIIYKLHSLEIRNWKKISGQYNQSESRKEIPFRPPKPIPVDVSCGTTGCDKLKVSLTNDSFWPILESILKLETDAFDPLSDPGKLIERNEKDLTYLSEQLYNDTLIHQAAHKTSANDGETIKSLSYNDICQPENYNHRVTVYKEAKGLDPEVSVETTKQILCFWAIFRKGKNATTIIHYYHTLVKWQDILHNKNCTIPHKEHADKLANTTLGLGIIQFVIALTLLFIHLTSFRIIAERSYFSPHPLPMWFEKLPGEKTLPSGLGHRSNVDYPPYMEPYDYNPNDKFFTLPSKKSKPRLSTPFASTSSTTTIGSGSGSKEKAV